MFVLNTRVAFQASHRLTSVPAGHQCGRLHGHSYNVEIAVAAECCDPVFGWIIDAGEIKHEIRKRYDHRHLNDVLPAYIADNPTAENMALEITHVLKNLLQRVCHEEQRATVVRVAVHETESTFVEYIADPPDDDDTLIE